MCNKTNVSFKQLGGKYESKGGLMHKIWSNRNLSLSKWEEGLREYYELNNLSYDDYSEEDHYNTMVELNDMYLDDERHNLDKNLGSTIIAIAELGFWCGRKLGYKLIESGNIKDCLYDNNCEYREWYVDEKGDMRFTGHHHDGTHHYLYRALKNNTSDDAIERLTEAIINRHPNVDALVKKHTNRIGTYVGDVYGWRFPGRRAA